jgi:hypothetical protein
MNRFDRVSSVLLLLGVYSWLFTVSSTTVLYVPPEAMLGLASVLPLSFWVSLGLVCLSLVTYMVVPPERCSERKLFVQVLCLTIILYWTALITEPNTRIASGWFHFGEAKYVIDYGQISPERVDYHQWPLWFVLTAALSIVSNLPANLLMKGGVMVFSIFYLVALRAMAGHFTRDIRKVYLFISIFTIGNWIGQDYWSPQFVAFLMYIMLWIFVLRFPVRNWNRRILVVFLLLFLAVTATHPLTPIAFILSILGLKLIKSEFTFRVPLSFTILFFLGWQFKVAPFGLLEFIPILPSTFSSPFRALFFTQELSRLYYPAPGTFIRLYIKGTLIAFYTLISLAAVATIYKYRREVFKLAAGWIGGAFVFAFLVRFSFEIVERFILFCLIPMSIVITYFLGRVVLEKPKKAYYAALLGVLMASAPLSVAAHYGNESFEQIPTSLLYGHWFFTEYGPSGAEVFDQSAIVCFYNYTKFGFTTWETENVSAPFPMNIRYYIVDSYSLNSFKVFKGTMALSRFEENATISSRFDIIYDSPTVRILMRHEG